MLCLDCGIHYPAGRTACVVCGAELRDAAKAILIPARPNINERDALEDSLWPPPTVFILDDDEAVDPEEPDAPSALFDDAQADDDFEQSLSGVKLEDLVDEDEDGDAPEGTPEFTSPPIEPEPPESSMEITAPRTVADASVEEPAGARFSRLVDVAAIPELTNDFETAVPLGQIITDQPESAKIVPARSAGGRLLRTFTAVLIFAAVFAAGAASGFWYAGATTPKIEAAQFAPEPPPGEAKPQTPTPPEGMVYVPGGNFLMGSDDGEVLSRPAHFVAVRPFFIDRTEVTNEQYRRFVEATGYDPPSTWKDGAFPAGDEMMPVTGITWYDAAAYAAWAGKRLPTEAEWEFAARGAKGRKYPWGNEWDPSLANVENRSDGLMRAGETAASPLGIHDLVGNAWEWTASDARPYPGGKEFPWSKLKLKIIRGGNWKSNSETAAATFRGYYGASGEKDYSSTSFRCVKDIAN